MTKLAETARLLAETRDLLERGEAIFASNELEVIQTGADRQAEIMVPLLEEAVRELELAALREVIKLGGGASPSSLTERRAR